jgi:hypothetical protein
MLDIDVSCSECDAHYPRGVEERHEAKCPVMANPKKWGLDPRDYVLKGGHWEHRHDYGPWYATPNHIRNMRGVVRFYLRDQKNYRRVFTRMGLEIDGRRVDAYRDQFLNWARLPPARLKFHDRETCVEAPEFIRDSGYDFWMPRDGTAEPDVILPWSSVLSKPMRGA